MSGICPCTVGNSVSKALFGLRDVKKLNRDIPEESAPATVLSRRVHHSNTMYHESPWQYLVTFRLENGEEKELQTTEDIYKTLPEGKEGFLTWMGEAFVSLEER